MKLASLALCVALIVVSTGYGTKQNGGTSPQTSMFQAQMLELKLKRLDAQADSVDVDVSEDKGNTARNAKLNIKIEGQILSQPSTTTSAGPVITSGPTVENITVDLSNVDLPQEYVDEAVHSIFQNTTCGTIPGVKISQVGVTADYIVQNNYTYTTKSCTITIPKGFQYDRASIPKIFWIIIDKDSLGNVAPLIHDYLYRHGGVLPTTQVKPYRRFSRKDADDIFLEAMTKCNVNRYRRKAAYQAVRKAAVLSWKAASNH